MPYLEKDIVTRIWKPTKETVEAVKKGTLFIEKVGQKYVMNDFIKKDGLKNIEEVQGFPIVELCCITFRKREVVLEKKEI